MAEVVTNTTFVLKLTEKEYGLVTKGLALMAGLDGVKCRAEERGEAATLNLQILNLQATAFQQKLKASTDKIKISEVQDTEGNH